MRGLTPDQRFEFDVRGYVVIEGAVDAETLAQLQPRLDVFEQAGQRYRREHPEIVDERIDEVDGKKIGLHIQDSGQKLWVFDPLNADLGLASLLAANPKVRPYVEEMVPHPKLGNFTARFQWQVGTAGGHGAPMVLLGACSLLCVSTSRIIWARSVRTEKNVRESAGL
jgi:hypothetical protein